MVKELICARNLGEHFLNELAHEMAIILYREMSEVQKTQRLFGKIVPVIG